MWCWGWMQSANRKQLWKRRIWPTRTEEWSGHQWKASKGELASASSRRRDLSQVVTSSTGRDISWMNKYWINTCGNFRRSPSEGARSEDNLSGRAREGSHVRDNLSFEQPYLYLIYPFRLIFICHLVWHSYFPLNGKYLVFSLAFDICRFSATVGAIPPNKTEVNFCFGNMLKGNLLNVWWYFVQVVLQSYYQLADSPRCVNESRCFTFSYLLLGFRN